MLIKIYHVFVKKQWINLKETNFDTKGSQTHYRYNEKHQLIETDYSDGNNVLVGKQ